MSEMRGLRAYWTPVLRSADVTAELPQRGRIFGEDVVVWRTRDGGVSAAHDVCPHRGARLSGGWVDDGALVCPYHAWAYGADGRACRIPQLEPGLPLPPKARLRTIAVTERYGLIWCALEPPIAPLPVFPEGELPGWRLIFEFFEPWSASALRIIDNSLDLAHVPIVHRNTIGDVTKPRLARYDVVPTDAGFRFDLAHEVQDIPTQSRTTGDTTRRSQIELVGPFAMIARIRYGNGSVHALFTLATPLDDRTSLFIQLLARNDTEDVAPAAELVALDRRVTLEDKTMLEMTEPAFTLDLHDEVHLPADRSTIAYRRYLARIHAAPAAHVTVA